jgi:hypothetical protein
MFLGSGLQCVIYRYLPAKPSEAGTARGPALSPKLLPIPDPVRRLIRQRESHLMRKHTNLPAMVCFMSKHVAQHLHANRPRRSPAVSAKLLDAALTTAQRFSQHLPAACCALGQSLSSLLRRAVRAVELNWNLQMRSRKPDPLTADIVHVREDRRNGAGLVRRCGRRLGSPRRRVKMFDKHLVHAIIGRKDLDWRAAELSVNLVLTHAQTVASPTTGARATARLRIGCRFQYVSERHTHSIGPNSKYRSQIELNAILKIHIPSTA